MKPDTVSQTALGNAAGRAIESCRDPDDRLFEDPYAFGLLPRSHRTMVRLLRIPLLGPALLAMRERQIPGVMGNLWCRTRFIDDAFRGALEEGFEQFVMLGAGLDTRAYRLVNTPDVLVFEVDHPSTQAWKRKAIERLAPDRASRTDKAPGHRPGGACDRTRGCRQLRQGGATAPWVAARTPRAVPWGFDRRSRLAAAPLGLARSRAARRVVDL